LFCFYIKKLCKPLNKALGKKRSRCGIFRALAAKTGSCNKKSSRAKANQPFMLGLCYHISARKARENYNTPRSSGCRRK
jgi:hypothetical protein